MDKFIHIFPLSIYRDHLVLPPDYKRELVERILEMERTAKETKQEDSAWLGDTEGHEFLFQDALFAELYRGISRKVKDYTAALGVDNDLIDFYFQRSWATVTRTGEHIHEHAHEQSNISFAYYLLKPPESGGINFITYRHPNEISTGIFTPAKAQLGFIKNPSMLTWNNVHIDAKEDEIVIFPSKTLHSTAPNQVNEPRISISADITTMLRSSRGHETMMPHFSQWRALE